MECPGDAHAAAPTVMIHSDHAVTHAPPSAPDRVPAIPLICSGKPASSLRCLPDLVTLKFQMNTSALRKFRW
jgi:hypothetical protein